jgi:hypothetical protein
MYYEKQGHAGALFYSPIQMAIMLGLHAPALFDPQVHELSA